MIPGTGKETARLALALMNLTTSIASLAPSPDNKARVLDAKRRLNLAECRELVAAGVLPGSSPYAHTVALAVDMVGLVVADSGPPAFLYDPAQRALDDTATGAHSLWFNDQGAAFLSFELEEDATLFRLALDA